ncbi:MAG: diacylglycerol/lipid kinase family protein [Acidimicrobiales bacterium]
MPGIVFLNPHSGRRHHTIAELRTHFHPHNVQETPPRKFAEAVRASADAGADFVGVAGGDGTIRGGAQPLLDGPVPLLAVPAGTRNHFAHQLGITDLASASEAIRQLDQQGRLVQAPGEDGPDQPKSGQSLRTKPAGCPNAWPRRSPTWWSSCGAADKIDVALDGEIEGISPPLVYRSRPGALKVLIPATGAKPHVLRHRPARRTTTETEGS